MATDIVDKDLKALRNARWEKAFQKKDSTQMTKEDIDRKATIVIEHLIQASDVSHTMRKFWGDSCMAGFDEVRLSLTFHASCSPFHLSSARSCIRALACIQKVEC